MNVSRNFTSWGSNFIICGRIKAANAFVYIFLLPVFLFIVCVGFQQSRKPRSRSSTATHADVFTFNMAAIEIVGVIGSGIYTALYFDWRFDLIDVVESLGYTVGFDQALLHILVCLERYLAVVHPITYLRLKKNGAFIRNASMAVVWLLSVGMVCIYQLAKTFLDLFFLIWGLLSLVLVSYFCARVLHVLIRPGPGDGKRVDQTKRRAFYTVSVITAALMLRFVFMFVLMFAAWSKSLEEPGLCLFGVSTEWLNTPSSLVLPLLFLCRRVKQH